MSVVAQMEYITTSSVKATGFRKRAAILQNQFQINSASCEQFDYLPVKELIRWRTDQLEQLNSLTAVHLDVFFKV
jgi:hypothetical protein